MIVTCVHVHVKPEASDRFIEATIANHRKSLKEPGNLRFDLVRETEDPDRFMIYEAYESEEAAAAHKKTPHFRHRQRSHQKCGYFRSRTTGF